MNTNWKTDKYLITTIDPLHIGTGGQRLGRVDATVVRDLTTNVPKIPGTSLSGALKFFLDLALRNEGKTNICAATAGSDEENDHERSECPVCAAFGYTGKKRSMQGILQFSDADMLAFPVNSAVGPVWISTPSRVRDLCGLGSGADDLGEYFSPVGGDAGIFKNRQVLNFGWIMLERNDVKSDQVSVEALVKCRIPARYAERMVLVSEYVFANLVNSNMEVRTSVVIDPQTGAAKTGGLFTYEAVVKGTMFVCSITENDYAGIWKKVRWQEQFPSALAMLASKAFGGVEAVGIGGMTTRGFGRLNIQPMGE